MTALPECPEAPPDCAAIVEEFARPLRGSDLDSLHAALRGLQSRLGTAEEQPCDPERVQFLAHEINNRLTVINLQRALQRFGLPPAPPSP